eukprot:4987104-Pyramimonas_sp.AAC.1
MLRESAAYAPRTEQCNSAPKTCFRYPPTRVPPSACGSLRPGAAVRTARFGRRSQEPWVYSRNGPIRRRNRGYILAMGQSYAGMVGIFSRRTYSGVLRAPLPLLAGVLEMLNEPQALASPEVLAILSHWQVRTTGSHMHDRTNTSCTRISLSMIYIHAYGILYNTKSSYITNCTYTPERVLSILLLYISPLSADAVLWLPPTDSGVPQ